MSKSASKAEEASSASKMKNGEYELRVFLILTIGPHLSHIRFNIGI